MEDFESDFHVDFDGGTTVVAFQVDFQLLVYLGRFLLGGVGVTDAWPVCDGFQLDAGLSLDDRVVCSRHDGDGEV